MRTAHCFVLVASTLLAGMLYAQSNSGLDYSAASSWLCTPNGIACNNAVKNTAAVDCFYISPTAANDSTATVIAQYVSRFDQIECRIFAPVLRGDGKTDARTAWASYLERSNDGRGVVIIGWSRGAEVAHYLLATDIDSKASQARIVSAVVLDDVVRTPLKSMTPCYSDNQIECVLTEAELKSTWQLSDLENAAAREKLAAIVNNQSRSYLAVAAECDCKKQERESKKLERQ